MFVAIGELAAAYHSYDGVIWEACTGIETTLYAVAYGDSKFVAVGDTGYTYYSIDGITWTEGNKAGARNINHVVYGNGRFVLLSNSTVTVYYSTDGISWTNSCSNTIIANDLIFANGVFVIAGRFPGSSAVTYYSVDGVLWKSVREVGSIYVSRLTENNGKFVSVDTSGIIYCAEFEKEQRDLEDFIVNTCVTKVELETKADISGSNATGDWDINITGNAATATSAETASRAEFANCDKSGNVIADTYATKTELETKAPVKLISSGDFNDMVTTGFYTMKSASANKPASGNYYGLLVLKSDTGNYVEQIAFKESSYEMYIRTLSGTSWSNWEKVFINSKDISSSKSITATGRYALDAVQNNASVEGTLANKIAVVENNLSTDKTTLAITAYLQSVHTNVVRRNYKMVEICLVAVRTDGYDVPKGISLATIPEGYRPNTSIFAAPAILINGGSGAIEPCCVNVTAEGEINNLLRYTTASGFNQIYFHVSYIMD